MGTRHLTCVVKDGKFRVAQYGQWDGYPTGQGETVQKFLLSTDVEAFRKKVDAIEVLTQSEVHRRWVEAGADDSGWVNNEVAERFKKTNAHLSRDMGAEILNYIMGAEKPEVVLGVEFAADSLFCEWVYVIDLDENVLEVYEGFNKSPVPEGERFANMDKADGEYYPVKLKAKIPFKDLETFSMDSLERVAEE